MAHQVVGRVLMRRNQPIEALPELERGLSLRPDQVEIHNAIGQCHMMLGNLDRAEEHFNRLLAIRPEHALAHFNRASVWLKQARYKEGWIEYEWRFAAGLVARTAIPRPRWDGSPLRGRSILVHTEQGMGDVLQFMRFLPMVKAQAGRLVFACQKAMQELLRPTECVDEWFPIDQPAPINFQVYVAAAEFAGLAGNR